MRKIRRPEILDREGYAMVRDELRAKSQAAQGSRRIAVGEHMTFVFADRESILLELQDLLAADGLTRESVVLHELAEANELVPDAGELSAKLFIEVVDREERKRLLQDLTGLDQEVVLRLGSRIVEGVFRTLPGKAAGQVSTVNYLRFRLGSAGPSLLRDENNIVTLEVSHSAYEATTELPWSTRSALASDLEESD